MKYLINPLFANPEYFNKSFSKYSTLGESIVMHESDLETIRDKFKRQGITISQWARACQFRPENVYAVLSGKARGEYGEAYLIALELGLVSPLPENEQLSLERRYS